MQSLKQLYKIGYGPSSSHTMGPAKACSIFSKKYPDAQKFRAILYGSLAHTGKGHLTDQIIKKKLYPKECEIIFDYKTIPAHPNTMELIAYKDNEVMATEIFRSVGGGIVLSDDTTFNEEEIYTLTTWNETYLYLRKNNLTIPQYIIEIEGEEIVDYCEMIYNQMKQTVIDGLKTDGNLPGSLKVLRKAKMIYEKEVSDKSLFLNKKIYAYAFSASEENASGNVIVTAPTCGSCGVIPALFIALEEEFAYSKEKMIEALMVAGLFGNFVKKNGSISGAEAGCQAEIGTACAMAAAGATYLLDGTLTEIEQAAEMALEHHLGLTCDPIQGYVQIPCIERNAVCAIRAYDCAKLSKFLETGTSKITFDLVVQTMLETGKDLNSGYKETSTGGLAKNYKEPK